MFKPLTPKFEALTYDSHLIVRNLGGALIFGISLPMMSFLSLLIILHLANNFGWVKCKNCTKNKINGFSFANLLKFTFDVYMVLCLCAALNMQNLEFYTQGLGLSSIISMMAITVISIYPLAIFALFYTKWISPVPVEDEKQRDEAFTEEYNGMIESQRHY
jgi:hypothetical protein